MGTTEEPTGPEQLLVFDVDGVLYHYDRNVRVTTLATTLGVSSGAVQDALFASGIEDDGDTGVFGPDEYLAALSARLGVTVTVDAWVTASASASSPDFEVLGLAARACRVAKVAALTNNGALLKSEAPRILPELVALVLDRLYVSGEIGLAKPDPAAYWAVVDGCGFTVDQAYFVDDSPDNVEGARLAGLTAHHFTSAEGLASFLASHALLPA